ncbi:MAG TPA: PAS domain S-box protein [Opitutaceae bacterium]|nr:PAS domain S-box protein [Opitutaceae bacterium]
MEPDKEEEKLLRSVALQNANTILLARQRAEHDLVRAKEELERKTRELAHTLAMIRATLESTTDGIIVTDERGQITDFNEKFLELWGIPRAAMQAAEHREIRETLARQFTDPAQFHARTDEIYQTWPPETFDRLTLADGRVIERYSKIQRVADRNVGRVWSFRDITSRVNAERELREQGEWFKVTLSSIGDAVLTVNTNRRVAFLNPVAERLTGWSQAEALGRPVDEVLKIMNEDTLEPAQNPIDRALAAGAVVGLANHSRLVSRSGEGIPIEDSAAPIKNAAGEIIGAVMVFHDVSESREKEDALSSSETRFRLLSEVAPQMLWTADPDGTIDYYNERMETYIGRSIQADKTTRQAAIHPADRDASIAAWQKSLATGEPLEIEYRLRRHDGEFRWFVARAVPLRDPDGKIVRWYGSATDIHQHKLTAEALREEYIVTEQLNGVARALATELDLARIVQIITDAGTRITRAQFGAFFYNRINAEGESYMLYALSGVARDAFSKFPMPRATQMFGPTFRGEGVIRLDDVRQDGRFGKNAPHHGMPQGHLPVVSYLAVPVISRGGQVLGGLFFGHPEPAVFTERDEKIIVGVAAQAAAAMDNARLYEAEQMARASAERANKAKDDFLATLSHELRNPLNPVLLIASEAAQNPGLAPDIRADFEMIQRNVELEARLIDDLLDLTRITRRKMSLDMRPVEIHGILHEAIATVRRDAEGKTIVISSTFNAAKTRVMGDAVRLQQIFWNVLRNAVKFTPDKGRVTIHTFNPDKSGDMHIEVTDTGIGMTSEEIARIFEAFSQGDHATSSGSHKFGGLGLGLAIAHYLVRMHGGRIHAKSAGANRGSTFVIELPLLDRELPGEPADKT